MNKKMIHCILAATALSGVTAACGSSSSSGSKTTAAAATAAPKSGDSATTAAAGAKASANPDVKAYCDSVDQLADQLKKVMANPAGADTAAVVAKATDLAKKAAGLMSASPADTATITECSTRLTKAMTPGG